MNKTPKQKKKRYSESYVWELVHQLNTMQLRLNQLIYENSELKRENDVLYGFIRGWLDEER